MNAKLKLDLKQGIVEVEGTEEFVTRIYSDYKERIAGTATATPPTTTSARSSSSHEAKTSDDKKRAPASRPRASSSPSIAKDLDLAARNGGPSLKEFCAPYAPSGAKEWNLLFLYFLHKYERATPITQDHIYTCYKTLVVKPPVAFGQSLFDTGGKKGWLEPNSLIDIKLTIAGENYVDHDFPKKEVAN